jgi:predicted nuclease with TOPRIM domain
LQCRQNNEKNQFSIFHIVLVVVQDDHVPGNGILNGGMNSSKSIDSINSYENSRNDGLDDNEQGDDIEKARLISQVLELQNTLDDLNQRVDGVKEENLRLRSENLVLSQYIENLMSASSVFSSTSPSTVAKKK